MRRDFFLLAAVSLISCRAATGSSIPVSQCDPASHICQGRCPRVPPGAQLEDGDEGLCLKDSQTGACVCWLRNIFPDQHLQTLFKCEASANGTVNHVMCLPPPVCFSPETDPSCMIVLQCPCTDLGRRPGLIHSRWHSVVAFVLRSKTPVPALTRGKEGADNAEDAQSDVREFSMKHLLFLLAFVIAPLLCWCLLTFFHEGKCRKRRMPPEAEPMPTTRVEDVEEPHPSTGSTCPPVDAPTAPKLESPPPYGEALDPEESCPLASDCGPPPSYEDAIRDHRWQVSGNHIQEV